jgi:hypothetical protein
VVNVPSRDCNVRRRRTARQVSGQQKARTRGIFAGATRDDDTARRLRECGFSDRRPPRPNERSSLPSLFIRTNDDDALALLVSFYGEEEGNMRNTLAAPQSAAEYAAETGARMIGKGQTAAAVKSWRARIRPSPRADP